MSYIFQKRVKQKEKQEYLSKKVFDNIDFVLL